MEMDVSIIIPLYNNMQYIAECLDSIANQDFKGEVECIIIDDCSKDNSYAVAEEKLKQLQNSRVAWKLIRQDNNQGASAARNRGIRESKGKWIMFVDSDDTISEDAVSLLMSMTEKYPDVQLIQGGIKVSDEKVFPWLAAVAEENKDLEYCNDPKRLTELASERTGQIPMCPVARLLSRDFIFGNNLLFDEAITACEDEIYLIKIARVLKSAAWIHRNIYFYRIVNSGITQGGLGWGDIKRLQSLEFSVNLFDKDFHPYGFHHYIEIMASRIWRANPEYTALLRNVPNHHSEEERRKYANLRKRLLRLRFLNALHAPMKIKVRFVCAVIRDLLTTDFTVGKVWDNPTGNIRKIVLMNSQIERSNHEVIDSCLAIAANAIVPAVELAFLKGHNDCVRTLAEKYDKDIRFTTSDQHLPKFVTNLRYGPKKFCMALHEAYVFLKKGGRHNVTFLTYLNPFNMYLMNFISRLTSWPLIFCVHAEAEIFSMPKEEKDGIRKRLGKRFYKHTKLGKHVSMMVLGDNILSTLLQRLPESQHYKFTTWEHPYFETKERQSKNLGKEIKVGVIGFVRAEKARGFDNILEFAKQLESHPDISLALLGPIMQKEYLSLIPSTVDVKNPTGTLVDRSIYEKWIEELDYIYCPYPDEEFQLTASGAILEAIISRRPIISHANAFTLNLRKKNGEFGLMIENENWQEIINQLRDPARYDRLVEEQNKLISMLAPENYVEKLRKIIETVV